MKKITKKGFNRTISLTLILVMLMTVTVWASAGEGTTWTGTYKTKTKDFRAYIEYKWEPNYSKTEARLTVTSFGIQCMSKSKKLAFPEGSEKKAALSMSITPAWGPKVLVADRKNVRLKFKNAKKGAKVKFGSGTFIFKKGKKKKTLTVSYSAFKGVQAGAVPYAWQGSSRGSIKLKIPKAKPDKVKISLPASSRGSTAVATIHNTAGRNYKYKVFRQTAKYKTNSEYLADHGCSTCALTTVLNAVKGTKLTPDKMIGVIKSVNKAEFDENFSKPAAKKMPVSLHGITKVFDKYGVRYKYGTGNAKEVVKWLKAGDPVIMTFADGSAGGLSDTNHTVVLLGIQNGKVIIGDSTLKSEKVWGKDGLIKHGKLTVADMMSYIKSNNWNVATGKMFYSGPKDRGYILVKK